MDGSCEKGSGGDAMIEILLLGYIYAEVYGNGNVFKFADRYGHAIGKKKVAVLNEIRTREVPIYIPLKKEKRRKEEISPEEKIKELERIIFRKWEK